MGITSGFGAGGGQHGGGGGRQHGGGGGGQVGGGGGQGFGAGTFGVGGSKARIIFGMVTDCAGLGTGILNGTG